MAKGTTVIREKVKRTNMFKIINLFEKKLNRICGIAKLI